LVIYLVGKSGMRIITSLLLGVIFGFGAAAIASDRPNVLLICVDDLKPLLGCYGDTTVKSPNIDRLAARGLRFERAYCNQAVCAPSRNALLTGWRPQTLGIYDLGTNFREAAPDAITLPQHFMAHGYRAEGLGKVFHVGHGNHNDRDSWSVPHWNADVVRYALPESRAPRGLTREEALFSNEPGQRAARLPRGAAYESADVPDSAYPDGQLAEEAIRRLQSAAKNPDQPFFIAVGFVKPHLPFCAPKKYWDLYDRSSFALPERRTPPDGAPEFAPTNWGELRQYSQIPESGDLPDELQRTLIHGYHAAVSYMDAQLGRVIEALDEAGLTDNTIIVFWGDHGWHLGDHGMWCKHSNYEQAARIPLIVVAPGVTDDGAVSQGLVESVDIYPTLCNLAGLPVPEGLDGTSFHATLKDPVAATKEAVFHVYPRGNMIGRAVRTARHRLVEWKRPGADADSAILELYDYEADPDETKNLAAEQPEVVVTTRAILAKWPEAKPQLRIQNNDRQREKRNRRRAARGGR
jgi:iduronate 2-sulfatase